FHEDDIAKLRLRVIGDSNRAGAAIRFDPLVIFRIAIIAGIHDLSRLLRESDSNQARPPKRRPPRYKASCGACKRATAQCEPARPMRGFRFRSACRVRPKLPAHTPCRYSFLRKAR